MKSPTRNFNHYGVLTSLCIILAVCLASLGGTFRAADDWFHDVLLNVRNSTSQSNQVLLVYAPESFFGDPNCDQLSRLTEKLNEKNAAKIGLIFHPTANQLNRLNELSFASSIVVGSESLSTETTVAESVAHATTTNGSIENLSDGVKQGSLKLKLNQTVYRNHVLVSNSQIPEVFENQEAASSPLGSNIAVEFQLAEGIANRLTAGTEIGISYAGGPNSLPHIDAAEILADEIVTELVAGKIVLVGASATTEIGFVTPTTVGDQRMSRLELHGNVLNTLLRQNQLITPGITVTALLLLFLTAIASQFFRQIHENRILKSYAVATLLILTIGWFGLHAFSIKLPITAAMVAITVSLFVCLHTRFQTLKELIANWSLMRQTNKTNDHNPATHDLWTMISDSVDQTFHPNRMILMELKPGATHAVVTKTNRCTESEILERRRDVNREPFRSAVDTGAATRIRHRQFYVVDEDNECLEFVAPMIIASELVGFMMLEMTPQSIENWDNFENFLTQFTSDMAMLVNKNRLQQDHESRQSNPLQRLKQLPEHHRKTSLLQAEFEHRNLEVLLDNAFHNSENASVIYDVFGRAIRTNLQMVELLQKNGLVVDETDCVSLIESFTRRDPDECRKLFRQCVVEGQQQHIYLTPRSSDEEPRVMYLKPLSKTEDDREIASRCVCIQIVEGKIFAESQHWENEYSKNSLRQVTERLTNLEALGEHLTSIKNPGSDTHLVSEIITAIGDCRGMLDQHFDQLPEQCFSFDVYQVWNSCLQASAAKLESRSTKVVQRFEKATKNDQPLEAIANPILLEKVFSAIIDCMNHDATEESEIIVTSKKIDTKVYFHFSEVFGGNPIQELRKSLDVNLKPETPSKSIHGAANSVLSTSQLDQFHEIESWLNQWNATLNVRCCDSYRISIELMLSCENETSTSDSNHFETPTASKNIEFNFEDDSVERDDHEFAKFSELEVDYQPGIQPAETKTQQGRE